MYAYVIMAAAMKIDDVEDTKSRFAEIFIRINADPLKNINIDPRIYYDTGYWLDHYRVVMRYEDSIKNIIKTLKTYSNNILTDINSKDNLLRLLELILKEVFNNISKQPYPSNGPMYQRNNHGSHNHMRQLLYGLVILDSLKLNFTAPFVEQNFLHRFCLLVGCYFYSIGRIDETSGFGMIDNQREIYIKDKKLLEYIFPNIYNQIKYVDYRVSLHNITSAFMYLAIMKEIIHVDHHDIVEYCAFGLMYYRPGATFQGIQQNVVVGNINQVPQTLDFAHDFVATPHYLDHSRGQHAFSETIKHHIVKHFIHNFVISKNHYEIESNKKKIYELTMKHILSDEYGANNFDRLRTLIDRNWGQSPIQMDLNIKGTLKLRRKMPSNPQDFDKLWKQYFVNKQFLQAPPPLPPPPHPPQPPPPRPPPPPPPPVVRRRGSQIVININSTPYIIDLVQMQQIQRSNPKRRRKIIFQNTKWAWEELKDSYVYYSNQHQKQINNTISTNFAIHPPVSVGTRTYKLSELTQINNKTGKKRVMRQNIDDGKWQYKDDDKKWNDYDPETAKIFINIANGTSKLNGGMGYKKYKAGKRKTTQRSKFKKTKTTKSKNRKTKKKITK